MLLEIYQPGPPLSYYIADITYYAGVVFDHKIEKLLPDGSIFVLIDMQDGIKHVYANHDLAPTTQLHTAYVSGQHKGYIHIEVTHEASMMVLRFKLGGAHPFFNVPISTFNNRVQQLQPYWGDEFLAVRRAIIAAPNPAAKFALIDQYLMQRLGSYQPDPAWQAVYHAIAAQPGHVRITDLARQLGISQKHLITLFNKQVGLTPKALVRIFRFQQVIQLLEKNEPIDWQQIALDCGYYDQAHFAKDFYDFSGIRPSTYPAQKGEYMNFVPVQEGAG